MAFFSFQLPPFAPDYSGVASVFFDLNSVTAMHDASGCTGNYTGYDDPRWYGSRSGIFCSGLREFDAIMGDDDKLISRMLCAADELHPEVLCAIGSPVPMVIGCDMEGIGVELESRSGLPAFGFQTTGTRFYDYGVSTACIALLERFCEKLPVIPKTVQILGANPMDFAKGEDLDALKSLLQSRGFTVPLCLSQGYSLDQLKQASSAEVNLVVSRSGLPIAKYLQERFGTPYFCGLPVGSDSAEDFFQGLNRVIHSQNSEIQHKIQEGSAACLIIGEQVQANAIRNFLAQQGKASSVATLYGLEKELALPGDFNLPDEKSIRNLAKEKAYSAVVADPCICELLETWGQKQCIPLPQYAISSKFHHKSGATLIEEHFVAEKPLKAI